ncbi:hypothetical protein TWF718_006815 [Orbilia javanica]|uniref:Uncharacterized protein n=1 Tax=Orbilia javanica TaxID=47235 RepID=A0AAN8RN54_9PEZI
MPDPSPLCHSTPAKDTPSDGLAKTEGQTGRITAPVFGGFDLSKNFSFDFGASQGQQILGDTESQVISVLSEPQSSMLEVGDYTIPAKIEPVNIEIAPGKSPSKLVEEFKESFELSKKLHESLQRLASQLGSLGINAEKLNLISEPKVPQPALLASSNDVDYKISWQDKPSKFWNGPGGIDTTGVSQFDIDPDVVSVPSGPSAGMSFDLTRNKTSFFIQSEGSATQPLTNLPSNDNRSPDKSAIKPPPFNFTTFGTDSSKLKETFLPASTIEERPPIPDLEQNKAKEAKAASIRMWAEHIPASKPNEKHIHAFDVDKPIVDVPTNSIPKEDTSLKFSPPDLKQRTQRRHSDSFCSSGRARHTSAVTGGIVKPYDFRKNPKRQPRTTSRRMKYANRSPDKTGPRGDENLTLSLSGHPKQAIIQPEPEPVAKIEFVETPTGDDTEYAPYKVKPLLSEEELRSEPFFSKLLPFKDVKKVSEKNRRYARTFYGEQYEKLWVGAYETVKARRTGIYNPITGKREFDKRKGEKEIYDPSSERYGTVDWKAHQVFECYFGMRDMIEEVKKITERQEAAGVEIPQLKEQYENGEYGEFEIADFMATHIRTRELEITTILPDRLKKIKVRQTLMKRAAENHLWDIAKQDYKFHYTGEMLNGILYMRDYFSGINPSYTQDELIAMGMEIPHEEF